MIKLYQAPNNGHIIYQVDNNYPLVYCIYVDKEKTLLKAFKTYEEADKYYKEHCQL